VQNGEVNQVSGFLGFLELIYTTLLSISLKDVVDILIVTFIIYKAIQFIRDTRAVQLVKGIVFLIIIAQVVFFTNMVATGYFLSHALDWGVVTLAILFQPELRSLLERVGRGKLDRLNIFSQEETRSLQEIDMRRCIDIVTAAVANMAATRMGSIIVLERKTRLGDIIGTGTTLNADLSEQLLLNVFYPKSPLHDGAVILRLNRLYAAGCLLPLSQNHSLSRDLGTRHRAAIGVTEVSDAVVIVVSEESGIISLAVSGVIRRRLSPDALKNQLTELLITAEEKKEHTFASLFRKRVK